MNLLSLLWAVAEDLGSFAYGATRALLTIGSSVAEPHAPMGLLEAPAAQAALPKGSGVPFDRALSPRPQTALFTRAMVGIQVSEVQVPSSETPKLTNETKVTRPPDSRTALQKSTVMYTSSTATPIRSAPGAVGDAIYTVLPYGSMVMVLEVNDMWAKVASGPHTGWVYVDDLEDCAADVYPSFHIDEKNLADDPSTIRVRAIINDEFGAGDAELPLQCEEYVLYRLYKKGLRIEWPPIRPRIPGTWKEILKDQKGIQLRQEPLPGCIMEFSHAKEDGESTGYLAYVEAVFPDMTIQVSEANWPEEGIYNERIMVEAEWKALDPVFLMVS